MTNPMLEANPRSLDELFSTDPYTITDEELLRMVAELRAKRALWVRAEAEAKPGKAPKVAKTKAEKPAKAVPSLGDLGL